MESKISSHVFPALSLSRASSPCPSSPRTPPADTVRWPSAKLAALHGRQRRRQVLHALLPTSPPAIPSLLRFLSFLSLSLSLSSSSTSRNQEQSIRPFHRSAPPDHLPQIDRNRSSFITVASSPTRPCQAPALHRRESRWNRAAGPFFRPSSTSTSNSLVRSSFSSLDGSNRL